MTYFNALGQGRVGWKSPGGPITPSYLLDTYSGAAAAYSLRKLRTAYTGNAIRVRRSSDNTSQDIGFNADGTLDTTAMLSFVGSNNQALYSEEFDNAYWSKYIVSVTSNQTTAPDGTMTADLLAESTANNAHTLYNSTAISFSVGTSWNISVYVKKGPGASAPDTFMLGFNSINTPVHPAVLFNISSGTVVDSLNPLNDTNFGSSIVDTGNGWWRCSMWGTVTAVGNRYQVGAIRFNNNLNTINGANYAGNAQANMYIWGYQFQKALNDTSVLTTQPYTKTTATTAAGNGFVSIWYDQSGSGYNATQNASASQPQIIDSGSVLMINSKPSMKWSGANNIYSTPPSVANLTTLALITVVKPTNPNLQYGYYSHVYFPDNGGWGSIFQTATNLGKVGYRFGTGQSSNNNIYSMTVNNLIFGTYKNGSTEIARVNGSDVMTSTGSKLSSIGNTIATLNMGLSEGGTYFNGLQNEVIFYRVNKISDRIGIESNINTYYSIY